MPAPWARTSTPSRASRSTDRGYAGSRFRSRWLGTLARSMDEAVTVAKPAILRSTTATYVTDRCSLN